MKNTAVEILSFDTNLGWFGLARSAQGICASVLFRTNREEIMETLLVGWPSGMLANEVSMADVVQRVRDFTDGHRVSFDGLQYDLGACTAFGRCVYEYVRTVEWGETVSYGDVARAVNRPFAARAVGQTMSRNPLPLFVPCHRVISADGSIGGFGGGNSVALKRKMLALEGCHPRSR